MMSIVKRMWVFLSVFVISVVVVGCASQQNDVSQQDDLIVDTMLPMDADVVVATVNWEDIIMEEVLSIQQLFAQQWQQISPEDATEQLINQKLLTQQVSPLSIQETEAIFTEELAMQNITLEEYKEQLALQGMSYEDELEGARVWFAIQQYLETTLGTDFTVSDEEVLDFYNQYAQSSPWAFPPLEEIENDIAMLIQQQKQQEAAYEYILWLREVATIQYNR